MNQIKELAITLSTFWCAWVHAGSKITRVAKPADLVCAAKDVTGGSWMIRRAPNSAEITVALENLDVLRLQNLLSHKLGGLDQATGTSADD